MLWHGTDPNARITGGAISYAWFVWDSRAQGPTTLGWLAKSAGADAEARAAEALFGSSFALHPYQVAFDEATEAAFLRGARRVLGVMPTGGGKTICFARSAARCVRRYNMPTLVVAHRRELIRQAAAKLEETGIPARVLDGSRAPDTRPGLTVHVGSVQTLANRLEQLPRYGRIILDEAHHATAAQWLRLLELQPDAQVQGVTATPERLDGRGLGDVFDDMVLGPSIAELIGAGYLSPVRLFGAPEAPQYDGLKTLAGDWTASGLAEVMDRPRLTGDAADEYLWHCGGQPAIAFCATVAHAEHVAAEFRALGWRSEAVHGDLPVAVRDARINGLGDGSVEVLTTADLISEGVDIPAVACVINLAGTKSLAKFLQRVGRGLRLAPGKQWLTVLDHANDWICHGFPDADRIWTLEGRPKKPAPPAIRQCARCYAIFRPAPACPCCGHVSALAPDKGGLRLVASAPGELVEIRPGENRLRELPLRQLIKEAKGYTALLNLAQARGLPDEQAQKWLENKARFRARFAA